MSKREAVKVYGCCAHGFGLSWALFTICFLIINIIVFAEPQWIGDTLDSPGVGYVGLYRLCEFVNFGSDRICDGRLGDFDSILTAAFQASTVCIGLSAIVIILCILLFLLFICVEAYYVFIICGITQVIACILMFLGCVIFPAGWDHMYVRRICGDGVGDYDIGECEMRWAYILPIVGFFVILMLAIMAFCLACNQPRRWKNRDVIKRASKPVYVTDAKDGTVSSKPVKNKGYVVDVTSNYETRSMPPSYYRATPSHAGGRSTVYDAHTLDDGRPIDGRSDPAGPKYSGHGGTATRPTNEQTRHRSSTEPKNRAGSL